VKILIVIIGLRLPQASGKFGVPLYFIVYWLGSDQERAVKLTIVSFGETTWQDVPTEFQQSQMGLTLVRMSVGSPCRPGSVLCMVDDHHHHCRQHQRRAQRGVMMMQVVEPVA
jgi:hypothetical protein